jgi:hypothetical protein
LPLSAQTRAPILPPSSAEEAARRNTPVASASATADSSDRWYVRYADAHGKPTVSRWTTAQVVQAMKSDKLDISARIARDPKDPFLPFAQFPEFSAESHKLATRTKSKSKEKSLANQYAKIEKQYRRRKWWRILANFRDGTIGFVNLILYLVIVAAIIVAAIWGGLWLYQNKLQPMLRKPGNAPATQTVSPSETPEN